MAGKLNNIDYMDYLSNPEYERRGIGLLITGQSRDERSTMASMVLHHFAQAGRDCLSLRAFEVAAGFHFGQGDRLRRVDVLLINDLGELSQDEQTAINVIGPVLSVTAIIEHILDQRDANERATLVTTRHELPELASLFSARLASLLGGVGFSVRSDSLDGESPC